MKKYLYRPNTDLFIRIDKFLHQKLSHLGYSRQGVKELIEKGQVFVNRKKVIKPSQKISNKDVVEVLICENNEIKPVQGNLKILYEDDYLVVIDKPKGLVTHPAPSCKEPTLVNYLLYKFPRIKELDSERPGIVHRLDRDTTGLMVVALQKKAQELLQGLFSKRKIEKKYLALVMGVLEKKQEELRFFMDRDHRSKTKMRVYSDEGRESITRYRVIYEFKDYNLSLVEVEILTGRTHQIRVHFSHIGHPVLGDPLYSKGKKIENKIISRLVKRQMLHSWNLSFKHPILNRELKFVSKVPKDFFRVLLYVSKKRPMVVGVTGGVGCGKSMVAKLLTKGGVPYWSADKAVETLYRKGNSGYEMIKRSFGLEFVDEQNGIVNKKKLFMNMSQDENFRTQVEQIIHPIVFEDMMEFISKNKTKNMVILEIPLLIEAGWHKDPGKRVFDLIVGVFCSNEIRIKRLEEIRGWNKTQVREVDKWQLPQKEKLRHCDIIIDNSSTLEKTHKKVAYLRRLLREIRVSKVKAKIFELEHLDIV
ncbi:dephospho-CoA kinase [Desulfothermus naphthae]